MLRVRFVYVGKMTDSTFLTMLKNHRFLDRIRHIMQLKSKCMGKRRVKWAFKGKQHMFVSIGTSRNNFVFFLNFGQAFYILSIFFGAKKTRSLSFSKSMACYDQINIYVIFILSWNNYPWCNYIRYTNEHHPSSIWAIWNPLLYSGYYLYDAPSLLLTHSEKIWGSLSNRSCLLWLEFWNRQTYEI